VCLVLIVTLGFVIASCSSDTRIPASPSGANGSTAVKGGDTCSFEGVKVEFSGETSTATVPSSACPGGFDKVCIKAGSASSGGFDGLEADADGVFGGCYTITGLDSAGSNLVITRTGTGCPGLSHIRYLCGTPAPTPTPKEEPTPTPKEEPTPTPKEEPTPTPKT
jgi:hypothetical protein